MKTIMKSYHDQEQCEALRIFQEARAFHDDEKYEAASCRYRDALTIQESTNGFNHEDTGRIYWNMGWCNYHLFEKQSSTEGGKRILHHEAALSCLQMAWKASLSLYGEDHETTEFVWDDIATIIMNDMGLSIKQVTKYYKSMIEIAEMEAEADEYYSYGRRHRALQLYEKALDLFDNLEVRLHGSTSKVPARGIQNNLIIATIQHKLAVILMEQIHLGPARKLLRNSLVAYQYIVGPSHPTTLKIAKLFHSIVMTPPPRQGGRASFSLSNKTATTKLLSI